MSNTWLFYFVRLVVTGALAAGAVFWVVTGSSSDKIDEAAQELTALVNDPAAERVPAVVESSERKRIKVPRRWGRTREAFIVEGTVRTAEGESLAFTHSLPAEGARSFETGTDVVVIRDADPASDRWVLSDTTGTLTNLGTQIQKEGGADVVPLVAMFAALGLFGWAGRKYPQRRR